MYYTEIFSDVMERFISCYMEYGPDMILFVQLSRATEKYAFHIVLQRFAFSYRDFVLQHLWQFRLVDHFADSFGLNVDLDLVDGR